MKVALCVCGFKWLAAFDKRRGLTLEKQLAGSTAVSHIILLLLLTVRKKTAMASFDLSSANPLFALYACHAAILILKMFSVTFLTGRQRFSKKVKMHFSSAFLARNLVSYLKTSWFCYGDKSMYHLCLSSISYYTHDTIFYMCFVMYFFYHSAKIKRLFVEHIMIYSSFS